LAAVVLIGTLFPVGSGCGGAAPVSAGGGLEAEQVAAPGGLDLVGRWVRFVDATRVETLELDPDGRAGLSVSLEVGYSGTYRVEAETLALDFDYVSPLGPQAYAPHPTRRQERWRCRRDGDRLTVWRPDAQGGVERLELTRVSDGAAEPGSDHR